MPCLSCLRIFFGLGVRAKKERKPFTHALPFKPMHAWGSLLDQEWGLSSHTQTFLVFLKKNNNNPELLN